MARARSWKSKPPFIVESIEPRVLLSKTIYVDVNASGATHDGTSWTNAFVDLQQGLAAAVSGDEIHVADGTYKPTSGTDRTISFHLQNNLAIRGGYAGVGAVNPDARDVTLYTSTLSGELGPSATYSDNSRHVLIGNGVDSSAIVDGFTITAGYADIDEGAGLYCVLGSPTVTQCTFSSCNSTARSYPTHGYGGAAYFGSGSAPTISDCIFTSNFARYGGAVAFVGAACVLSNCTFSSNSCSFNGRAVFVNNAGASLNQCSFDHNSAQSYGGGFYAEYGASPCEIRDCDFTANTADYGAGLAIWYRGTQLTGCTLSANAARQQGGGAYFFHSGLAIVTNSDISQNTAKSTSSSGGIYNESSDLRITESTVETNAGGVQNYSATATIEGCVFLRNSARAVSSTLSTVNARFSKFFGNFTTNSNGGAVSNYKTTSSFDECVFSGNIAASLGGAINNSDASPSSITNCTIAGNEAPFGGAICEGSVPSTLINCIIWSNSSLRTDGILQTFAKTNVTFSDVQGGQNGVGNVDVDPFFIRSPSRGADLVWGTIDDDYGDLRLRACSPLVDAGSNSSVPAGTPLDLANAPRFQDVATTGDRGEGTAPVVDIGAYETTASLSAGIVGLDVFLQGGTANLTAVGGSDVPGPLLFEWEWSGDGKFDEASSSTAAIPLDRVSPGVVLNVSVRVTDNAGRSIVSSKLIHVVPQTVYVDRRASGANNGASWYNAYNELSTALELAISGQLIKVAGGTYKPTTGSDRRETFAILSGVAVVGGYGGVFSKNPDWRDPVAYPSVLSGDIGSVGSTADDSFHVVEIVDADALTRIDGFTIAGGRADGTTSATTIGAAIVTFGSAAAISNCRFENNYASRGGAVYSESASPTIKNCFFIRNTANEAGAIYAVSSTTLISNTCFVGNRALQFDGGAIENQAGAHAIYNCTFVGNQAKGNGGAIFNWGAPLVMSGCTVTDNASSQTAGGVYLYSPLYTGSLVNSIIRRNTAPNSAQLYVSFTKYTTVNFDNIEGGYAGKGIIDIDPQFSRNPNKGADTVWGTADDDYGDLQLMPSSPCIDAGDNLGYDAKYPTDAAGNYRLVDYPGIRDFGEIIDIGAYESAPALQYVFDATNPGLTLAFKIDLDVATLANSDLVLTSASTSLPISFNATVFYDAAAKQATWQFNAPIPDGDYRATLPAASVLDKSGNPLSADILCNFFLLAGDANRDRVVDINDLAILAANWQGAGKVFSQGDFNYDGKVDAKDLGILSTHWQQALPPPAAAAPVSVKRAPTRTATRIVSLVVA